MTIAALNPAIWPCSDHADDRVDRTAGVKLGGSSRTFAASLVRMGRTGSGTTKREITPSAPTPAPLPDPRLREEARCRRPARSNPRGVRASDYLCRALAPERSLLISRDDTASFAVTSCTLGTLSPEHIVEGFSVRRRRGIVLVRSSSGVEVKELGLVTGLLLGCTRRYSLVLRVLTGST